MLTFSSKNGLFWSESIPRCYKSSPGATITWPGQALGVWSSPLTGNSSDTYSIPDKLCLKTSLISSFPPQSPMTVKYSYLKIFACESWNTKIREEPRKHLSLIKHIYQNISVWKSMFMTPQREDTWQCSEAGRLLWGWHCCVTQGRRTKFQ